MYTTRFEVTTIRRGRTHTFISKSITFDDNNVANLGYGYALLTSEVGHEEDGTEYVLHRQILPKEGDKLVDLHSGEEYTVGRESGFVNHNAPLLMNGVEVGKLIYEDYYKD